MKPFVNWDGLFRCPYHFADDVACMYPQKLCVESINKDSYMMFGFHPIHVFLNTESLQRYEQARPFMHNRDKLEQKRGESKHGARKILEQLIF
ncbi:MAG: hypothetical protein K2I63_00355 [Helicobacter sp.]|nr:hypothetical protein [Helicobacter sp.]